MAESYLGGHTVINTGYEERVRALRDNYRTMEKGRIHRELKELRPEKKLILEHRLKHYLFTFIKKESEFDLSCGSSLEVFQAYSEIWSQVKETANLLYKYKKRHSFK